MGCPRRISQYDKKGNLVKVHFSAAVAAREMKITPTHLYAVANGRRKYAHGFSWKYTPEEYRDEIWIEDPDEKCFFGSSLGRIRHNNGAITFGYVRADGEFGVKHLNVEYLVARIIARLFIGDVNGKDVIHINGYSNAPENLRIVEKRNEYLPDCSSV